MRLQIALKMIPAPSYYLDFQFLCLIAIITCLLQTSEATSKKDLEVTINSIEKCRSTNELKVHVVQRQVKRQVSAYSGNLTLPYPHKQLFLMADVYKWTDSGWKPIGFSIHEQDPVRAMAVYMAPIWLQIQQQAGIPPGTFPVPPGFYKAENIIIDWDTINRIPLKEFLIPGRAKLGLVLLRNKKKVMCFNVFGEIKEKIDY